MELKFELFGQGNCAIIVETGLGSTYVEWRPVLKSLAENYTIFLYDRAGYGKSNISDKERTPKIIARQLKELVNEHIPDKKYLLIGHSIGGIYVQQFISDYNENVIGALFLDPATTEENKFKTALTAREYKRSGIDKSFTIKLGILVGNLGMLKLFKPLFRKSVPFYYYNGYDQESEKEILSHLTQLKSYKASFREYKAFQNQSEILMQLTENKFPQIPVRLLYHNPKIMIDEIVKFGGLSIDEATKIELLWKKIILEHYSKLSNDFKFETAEHSGHYIHLTDTELLYKTINQINSASLIR